MRSISLSCEWKLRKKINNPNVYVRFTDGCIYVYIYSERKIPSKNFIVNYINDVTVKKVYILNRVPLNSNHKIVYRELENNIERELLI